MSYLVLARKYRPASFAEVAGQEHVTRTLANAISRNRVGHAYLFNGPRGVGKTSIARIFAKALNCVKGPTATPCLECTNCKEITEGRSLAVLEIDGASHNSVDNVRSLIESFRSAPLPGCAYKVYIIDEVHMLSTSAFNALLKSLEEPPANTVFILATTEPHKIPETVISRCQQHTFKALVPEIIKNRLRQVVAEEGLKVEEEVLSMIARLSEGSMRDAQTLLDRVQSYCSEEITAREASEVLGAVDRGVLFKLSQAVFSHKAEDVLLVLGEAFSRGVDPSLFLKEFVAHWRELLIARIGGEKSLKDMGSSESDIVDLLRQVNGQSLADLQDLVYIAREGADNALRSAYPKYALEALLVRMATRENVLDFSELLKGLKSLVKAGPAVRETSEVVSEVSEPRLAQNLKSNVNKTDKPKTATSLDWKSFIGQIHLNGRKILVEQLKRLHPEEFKPGLLKVRGPEFTISYFKEKDNLAKLEELLNAFCEASWQVEFLNGSSGSAPEPGSILEVEQSQKKSRIKQQAESLSSHPSIQSLKKAFPGSTIESVKLKSK